MQSIQAISEEVRPAWMLTLAMLVALMVLKPLGNVPYLGSLLLTAAAVSQFFIPLWRMDRLGKDYEYLGLTLSSWRHDLKLVAVLILLTFPPYVVAYHFYMTRSFHWAVELGLVEYVRFLPRHDFAPNWPQDLWTWGRGSLWLGEVVLTHSLGVALPEETFYRGYLQPHLERRWPPRVKIFGVFLGRAAVLSTLAFALGHFLGEWNPLRLGPFVPGLVFAWQRNATGSILGCIGYHSACNVLGEILFTMYQPR